MKRYTTTDLFKPKIHQKWYVLANRSDAVIYFEGKDHQFHFVDRLDNPSGHLTEGELDSDRSGSTFSTATLFHHSLDRHNEKREQIAIRFAARIGKFLARAARANKFEEVTLIAEPHFLGILKEKLPSSVHQKKIHSLGREYSRGSMEEVRGKILNALG